MFCSLPSIDDVTCELRFGLRNRRKRFETTNGLVGDWMKSTYVRSTDSSIHMQFCWCRCYLAQKQFAELQESIMWSLSLLNSLFRFIWFLCALSFYLQQNPIILNETWKHPFNWSNFFSNSVWIVENAIFISRNLSSTIATDVSLSFAAISFGLVMTLIE